MGVGRKDGSKSSESGGKHGDPLQTGSAGRNGRTFQLRWLQEQEQECVIPRLGWPELWKDEVALYVMGKTGPGGERRTVRFV